MTSAEDLIAELERESPKFAFCCLVTHLDGARTVRSFDENKLEKLNDLLDRGAIAVGFIGSTQSVLYVRVLPEYEGDPKWRGWPRLVAEELRKEMAADMKRELSAEELPIVDGWIE
jgi:hypothetical protein